ncbi:OLC1v1006491C1 [Oldenlandia corymbosa var. corymbosa]|uniref:OLC1v1006491C1 n=1 Tax=Oldenlandia corymbosa var. corymbosa TaxID=529605 RepID=A0AAV1DJT5_OLDCO|nr:OLC1v1006491C1 [Oldenlandia corymbosa var. corymbosa]
MGSSMSCLAPYCSESGFEKKTMRQVMVMKDDGVIHCFKEGSHVKDVLVSHPDYQIIKCSSSDTIQLPESFRLNSNQLYFLIPKGASLNDKSINMLLKIAACRDPPLFVISNKGDDKDGFKNINVGTRIADDDDDFSISNNKRRKMIIRSQWKPSLKTIPEVSLSTILQSDTSAGGL